MSVIDVLQECRDAGIRIAAKDGKLLVGDAHSRLSPDLRRRLAEHKSEILAYLDVSGPAPVPRIVHHPELAEHPLSYAQRRLWFLHQLDPGSVEYNLSLALRVRGRLHTGALNAALDAIVARHAVLRTGFTERDGEPLQVVHPHRRLRVDARDLGALEPEARQCEALRIAREEARVPFDLLGQAPMLRCTLLRLADEEHAIVLTMHHIATDGWSMGVLVKEFMAHYAAAAEGASAALPPLAIQYGDYARWQHEARASGMLRESMEYWSARLAGLPEVHDLPLDHPRPPRQRFTAQRHHQLLDHTALDAAKRLAKESGATLFMLLQSVFAHLLSRWSGQREIVIGTPTAGRDQPETAPLIGFFNNTVVCRFDIEPGADARGLIAHCRTVALDAFTHQQVPFDLLVETFRPRRSLAYNPLCQIKFVLQNHDGGTLELPGLRFEPLAPGGEHVHFDLDLTATEREDGLHLGWTFKDELFELASVERMAGAYARLLHAMCAAPGLALDRIGLADPAGTRAVLALGRGPSVEQGRQATLVHAFECTVRDVPEHVAVRCGERSLTYRELDLRANRLAHVLIEQGLGTGDRVGVRLGRSIELLVGLLATHKAGAAYVPLDGRQSATQLRHLIENAQLRVVLHHSAAPVHATGVDTVFMDGADSDPRWLEGYPSVRPGVQVTLDDSAYVLYTSGSTGVPKGVEVTHRGMVDYCAFAHAGYYPAALSGSFVATSPAFDLTLPTLFLPLLSGDSVEMLAEDDAVSALAARLAAADCDNRLLRLTPSHAQGLLYLLDDAPLPQAHSFVVGGERFAVETARALQARFPAARIYNHYGPTETVVGCCWYDVSANLGSLARTVPIGRPMDNTVLYVLDAALQPAPLGVPGELYIGGAGVARGYLGQPALTAERFLEDPFAAGERVYRSGDRVRWRADGQLEFLGRADDQVKLRGFRIELGEIEHHLAGVPGVRRAAVRLIGEGEAARIVGYVEPAFAAEGIAGLHAALAQALPAYMLPTAIVALEALPLTGNGKVDRKALPVPAEGDGPAASEAPATGTERRLAALWQRILKRDRIDRGANFFAMGGHSLLATRLVGEIAREFGKPLPVRVVFEHGTLQELAAHLDAQAHGQEQHIPVARRDVPLPVSFAQQRLWFVDRLEGGSAQFNMPSALRLSGAFEPAVFQLALDALVERHEILRTVYLERDDGPIQQILATSASPLAIHDLREMEHAAREDRVQALRREEAARPFDLATDAVLRGALLRLRDDETVVLLTVHHIASDGWSNGILARELVELYGALRAGRAPALAPLPVQYADYALWQRQRLQGEGLRVELDYWRQRLAGIPWVHSLPLDRPRPAQQDFSGKVYLQFIDADDTAAVRAFCAQRGITLFVLMRAIFSMLIGRASREQDIVLGTPVAGRVHRDLEGLIGLFVNTLVLRTELDGNPRFDALLEHCRRDSLEAYAHQEIPFETLVDELKPARSLSYNPLVQILLNVFESVQDDPLAVEGVAASAVGSEAPESLSKADMTLYVRHCDDRLLLKWSYRSSLFDAATVQRLGAGLCQLLRQAIASPQSRILDYALLSEADRRATVAQAAPIPRDYDAALLHERVHAHALVIPDATALIHGHERVDYATLDALARSLASELQGLGISAGTTVGILADRGIDYAVAVLACLNAGMVYLPLATDLPQARIDYMLRDAQARAMLVQPHLRERAEGAVPMIALGARSGPASGGPATALPRLQASDGAHVLFTSGSTGQPKSVLGPHGALRNRVAWMLDAFPFADDEVCCLITSTAFVRAVWELAVPLAAGRPLLIVDAETVSDLAAFADLLAEQRVTRIVTAPSLARALTELPGASTLLSGLRYWFVSGEPLRPGIARRIRSMLSGVVLCNLYGSTETMSDVSFHVVGGDEPHSSLPIGKPIANSALLVLDEHLRPVPPGMPGEICVAGANLALGYPGRMELTDDKFVRHDFGVAFGERLYRTGDLGRVLADGAIECLGRLDHQVKVRGYRIELGEIEASLLRSTRVKDAVVAVHGGGEEGRLVAYLVAQTAGEDVVAAVRAELRAWLPEYMQPSTYVVMERLPLTANGKVDRRSLPAPEPAADTYMAPGTPTESIVAQIWCELLKLARVGSGDNFFEIGGHSLLATRMASALSARTGKAVSVRMVFEAPVLADIAQRIDAQTQAAQAPIPHASRSDGIPLSLAQQRLWFVSRFDGGAQYNLPTSLRIVGELDAAALQGALDALVARHEVLRTTYAERNGHAVQIVHPPASVPITAIDLSRLDDARRAEELQRLSRDDARMPFDLGSGPVLRCTLIALAPQEHALLFTVHHIASDGWSKGLLVREFVAVYAAQARGEAASLPPLDVQYADYAAWQRSPEQALAIARDLDYWKVQLAQLPQVHALPLDRPRPARQDYRAEKVMRRMRRPELERLRRLALDHDATLFMALQAGLALLVGRWSGETDVVIGSPVAGRTRRELEPLIGFFINSVALRFDLSGHPDVRTLLARARRTVLDAFAHQSASFEMLVETLRPERHLSHAPLFQVVLALQNHERGELSLPGLEITALSNDTHSIDLDLHVAVTEDEHGLQFRWLYATSLFDAATIERMAESYLAVLVAMAEGPEQSAMALPLLPEGDRLAIAQWALPHSQELPEVCAHVLFEQQAAAAPQAIAATFEGESITYGALNAQANRVAYWLRGEGVGPGQRVGLCVERSLDMLVGVLGILKSGAAYLPVDPAYPQERVEAMLVDGDVEHVLAHASVLEALSFLAERSLLLLDAELRTPLLAEYPQTDPTDVGIDPAQAAYAVFTSGSTGVPKGVLNTHRGLVNLALYQRQALAVGPGSRVLAFGSISFDGGVFEWLLALAHGGSLHICSEDDRHSVQRLSVLLLRERITHAAIPPALLAQVPLERGYALRLLIVAGEACDEGLAWRWAERCRVVNSYGPSEAAVAATHAEIVPQFPVTLGRALPNVEAQVLNGCGQPQPVGVAGELHLGGAGLALGYLGRPALTAERFVPHPDGGGRRLYRTGDLVRWLPGGELQFIGRADDQVKIRGFRVELGEIAQHLLAHPRVREATAIVREDTGDARLVAYVVPADGDWADVGRDLREHMRARVPDYLVPSAVVAMEALPVNRNGKVDKAALPQPDYTATREFIAPGGDTARHVAAIWQRVLKQERISAESNFFEIGGHSLLATQVISHVAEEFGRDIPIRALFEHPTIAGFARHIETVANRDAPPAIVATVRDRPLPLSFAQQRLWFIDRLGGGSAQYNMRFGVRLTGALDVHAVQQAIDAIIARHEVLRTTFAIQGGESVQIVHPPSPQPIGYHDLSALVREAREAALDGIVRAEAKRGFDLTADPMLRCTLVRLGDGEHALLLSTHHIASDGWSMSVLGKEFAASYAGFRSGQPVALAPLGVQYGDYASWQRGVLEHSGVLRTQLEYWRGALLGLPPVHALRLDKPRPSLQKFDGDHVAHRLDASALKRIKQLALDNQASLFMVLQSALAVLFGRWSGETDIVIGTPVAGRTQKALEPLIGFFINSLVLRTDLSGDSGFLDVVRRTRSTILDAYAHQDVPFEMLVETLRPERSLSHSPLYQISFTLHNHEESQLALPDLELSPLRSDAQQCRYDLEVHMTETDAGIHIRWVYATSLFERATIERMADAFKVLVAHLLDAPETAVSALPLLDDEARAELLPRLGDIPRGVPADRPLHRLFEKHAAEQPDAVAVTFGDSQWSYSELNRRANRVAHGLIAMGIKPDDRVVLCAPRGPHLLAGLLGILKAGGAYVPLDPAYPQERLHWLIQDSMPVALVAAHGHAFPATPMPRLDLYDEAACARHADDNPNVPGLDAGHLAYVIYTSGSTGTPKGVQVEHRQVSRLLAATEDHFRFGADDTWSLFHSFAFDFSVWEIWGALAYGGRLVVVSEECAKSPEDFYSLLCRERVTMLNQTPSAFRQLSVAQAGSDQSHCLRTVIFGGETLDPKKLGPWAERNDVGRTSLVNMYGITETTVHVTLRDLALEDIFGEGGSVIGRPIPGMYVYILDARMQPVPVGVAGEMYVGGSGVARGYLNREELTTQRFVRNPFDASGTHGRLYRSGDLARWTGAGEIEYLGRNDFQVKIRGFRIELGEIEARLARMPAVREVAVLAREDGPGEKRLVAYVVAEAGAAVDISLLRQTLLEVLPDYMVPKAFVVLAALPLTGNGKLDRRALPVPDRADVTLRDYAEPVTDTERAISTLWTDLMNLQRVSRFDEFFELGGHSVLAIRLVAMLSERFQVRLHIRDLFRHPLLVDLARHVDDVMARGASDWDPLVPLDATPGIPVLYCVPAAGLTAVAYRPLAKALQGRLALRVFEPRGTDGVMPPSRSMEETVALNLQSLLACQSQGPYLLAGHSYGGAVAFEMARLLEMHGHQVQLILIDSGVYLREDQRAQHSLDGYLARMLEANAETVQLMQGFDDEQRLHALFSQRMQQQGIAVAPQAAMPRGLLDVFRAQLAIHRDYSPSGRFGGPMASILARDGAIACLPAGELADHYAAYAAAQVQMHIAEGGHLSLLSADHAPGLADLIAARRTDWRFRHEQPA